MTHSGARNTSARMNHYYSDEWCKDNHARTQDELQSIAKQIREHCEVEEIIKTRGQNDDSHICTTYTNEALGLKYWIKDTFGHISEITEARYF